MACITNDGSNVIRRTIEETDFTHDQTDLIGKFDIDETSNWIISNNFKNIGLQFPNELLPIAVPICQLLTSSSGRNCLILGDSTFAGCCVDEIVGQRASIDALVHYGRACLSKTVGRLPIFYVFGKMVSILDESPQKLKSIIDNLLSRLITDSQSKYTSPIVITYDFRYRNAAKMLYDELTRMQIFSVVYWSEPNIDTNSVSPSNIGSGDASQCIQLIRCGRIIYTSMKETEKLDDSNDASWTLIYIGPDREAKSDSFTFYRILLSLPEVDTSKAFTLDPLSGDIKSCDTSINSLLKRRSHLIERVKDAHRFGLLVGTLSINDYPDILERLKRLLTLSGRSFITLFVGRLNEAKLANLSELEVLVFVACPETSLLDSRELFIPVVTPFEVECALGSLYEIHQCTKNARIWTGTNFWLDFKDLLPGGKAYLREESIVPHITEALGDMSLITGQVRITKPSDQIVSTDNTDDTALVYQEPWKLATSSHWDSNSGKLSRTWYGLSPQIGQTPVAQIKDGRRGVPTHYSHETNTSNDSSKTKN